MANFDVEIPFNKFKNEKGLLYLGGLFWERKGYGERPLYTIKDEDLVKEGNTYPSLYKLYMQEEDLSEYIFATKHLFSWEHWQELCQCIWFQPILARWRTELELKLKAEALQAIIQEARIGGRNSYDAKKYLVSKGWIAKEAESSRRGRPSKADIQAAAAEEALSHYQVNKDLERLTKEELN